MGSSANCRSESCKCMTISRDIEIDLIIQSPSENIDNLKVKKFEIIYYYCNPKVVLASNLISISKFIPGLNLITIPLSLDRDLAHAGLIIFCEKDIIYITHKTAASIVFYKVSDEISAIYEMNTLDQMNFPNQRKYAYICEVKENVTIKEIYDFIKKKEKIYNLWSKNCQHFIKDILNKFKK